MSCCDLNSLLGKKLIKTFSKQCLLFWNNNLFCEFNKCCILYLIGYIISLNLTTTILSHWISGNPRKTQSFSG